MAAKAKKTAGKKHSTVSKGKKMAGVKPLTEVSLPYGSIQWKYTPQR